MSKRKYARGAPAVRPTPKPTPKPAAWTPAPDAPIVYVTEHNASVAWCARIAGLRVADHHSAIPAALDALKDCHGLIVTGGGDVNPAIYGEAPHVQSGKTPTRDLRELALLGAARSLGLPVFGICRGMQIIAAEAGGTLHQHVPDRVGGNYHEGGQEHVLTVRGSIVARALGERALTLHLHHQSVKRLPFGFSVTARHVDGTVEAMESLDGRVLAVQFHPELGVSPYAADNGDRLFTAFARTCKAYKRRTKANGVKPLPGYDFAERWPVAAAALDDYLTRGVGWHTTDKRATSKPKPKPKPTTADAEEGVTLTRKSWQQLEWDRQARDTWPVGHVAAFCESCGIAFDYHSDYEGHMDTVHAAVWNA